MQRCDGSGCATDRFLRLSFGDTAGGPCAQREFRLVVGGSHRSTGDGSRHRQGRLRWRQGKGLLLNPHTLPSSRAGAAVFAFLTPQPNPQLVYPLCDLCGVWHSRVGVSCCKTNLRRAVTAEAALKGRQGLGGSKILNLRRAMNQFSAKWDAQSV